MHRGSKRQRTEDGGGTRDAAMAILKGMTRSIERRRESSTWDRAVLGSFEGLVHCEDGSQSRSGFSVGSMRSTRFRAKGILSWLKIEYYLCGTRQPQRLKCSADSQGVLAFCTFNQSTRFRLLFPLLALFQFLHSTPAIACILSTFPPQPEKDIILSPNLIDAIDYCSGPFLLYSMTMAAATKPIKTLGPPEQGFSGFLR